MLHVTLNVMHSDYNKALFEVSLIKRQTWPLCNISQSVASQQLRMTTAQNDKVSILL